MSPRMSRRRPEDPLDFPEAERPTPAKQRRRKSCVDSIAKHASAGTREHRESGDSWYSARKKGAWYIAFEISDYIVESRVNRRPRPVRGLPWSPGKTVRSVLESRVLIHPPERPRPGQCAGPYSGILRADG